MDPTRLPPDADLAALVPRPGSPVWEVAADARLLAGAGAALVLQVAHPTVAAGVREHSDFARDPWGRLVRTLDFTNALVYGGPGPAIDAGRRVWALHARINGVTPGGRPYSAREPEAYAWVHATLADSIVASHRMFVGALDGAEVERFWAQWRELGRLVGVAVTELPERWSGFEAYRERMIAGHLGDNDVVREVLAALRAPAPPPLPTIAASAWRFARIPVGRLLALATVGLLPPALRERLGLGWGRFEALELRALAAASCAVTPILPRSVRDFGATYRRLRGEAGGAAADALPAAA